MSPTAERQHCAAELHRSILQADRVYYECERRLAAFDRTADARVRQLVAAGQVRPTLSWLASDAPARIDARPPSTPATARRAAARRTYAPQGAPA